MTFRGFIFIGAAIFFSFMYHTYKGCFPSFTESDEKLRFSNTSVDFKNYICQSPHPTGTLYKHITISFLYGWWLMNNRLKKVIYKLQIYRFFLYLPYERYCMILRGKLYIIKICGFLVKCYMTSLFQCTGLKEFKYNIFVKHMQDRTTHVHLFRFYVAMIAALSSIQFKSKLRTYYGSPRENKDVLWIPNFGTFQILFL